MMKTEILKTTDGMTCAEMRDALRTHRPWINRTNIARARRAQLESWMATGHVLEAMAGRKLDRRLTAADIEAAWDAALAEDAQRTPRLRIISVAIIDNADGIFEIVGMWGGAALDRPASTGYAVRGRRLAERLAQAMRDGKVFRDAEVKIDVNGRTYVSASSNVLGRTANADLCRLGY